MLASYFWLFCSVLLLVCLVYFFVYNYRLRQEIRYTEIFRSKLGKLLAENCEFYILLHENPKILQAGNLKFLKLLEDETGIHCYQDIDALHDLFPPKSLEYIKKIAYHLAQEGQTTPILVEGKEGISYMARHLSMDRLSTRKLHGKQAYMDAKKIHLLAFRRDLGIRQQIDNLQVDKQKATAQNKHFSGILDAVSFPIWIRHISGKILFVNKSYVHHVEQSDIDTVKEEQIQIYPWHIHHMIDDYILDRLCLKIHIIVEGSRKLYHFQEMPYGDQGYLIGFGHDITDSGEAELMMERQIGAQQFVLGQLSTAVAIFDANMELVFANESYAKMWSFPTNYLNKRPDIDAIIEHMRDHRSMPEYVDFHSFKKEQKGLFTSLIDPQEDVLHLPDNRTIRRLVAPHPLGGLLFLYEDVTDKLKLERSFNILKQAERETINHLSEGVAVFASDGKITLFNPAFCDIWRLTADRLRESPHITNIFTSITEFPFDIADWDICQTDLLRWFAERETGHRRIEMSNGTVVNASSVPLPDGKIMFSFVDISDSFRAERALLEKNALLLQTDRKHQDLIEEISYQIRTPLNVIVGFSELLEKAYHENLNPQQAGYINSIHQSSLSLSKLIDNIMCYASADYNGHQLDLCQIQMQDIIDGIERKIAIESSNFPIDFDYNQGDNTYFNLDNEELTTSLAQILLYVQYNSQADKLTLSMSVDEQGLYIACFDSSVASKYTSHETIKDYVDRFGTDTPAETVLGQDKYLPVAIFKYIIALHQGVSFFDQRKNSKLHFVAFVPAIIEGS